MFVPSLLVNIVTIWLFMGNSHGSSWYYGYNQTRFN